MAPCNKAWASGCGGCAGRALVSVTGVREPRGDVGENRPRTVGGALNLPAQQRLRPPGPQRRRCTSTERFPELVPVTKELVRDLYEGCEVALAHIRVAALAD
jgi:hypothetical protein